jgi:hypothetical protein
VGTTSTSGVLVFLFGSSNDGALLLPKSRPRSPALLPDHAAAAGRGRSLPAAEVAGPRPSAADGPDASGLVRNGDVVVDSSLLDFEARFYTRYTVRDTGPAEGGSRRGRRSHRSHCLSDDETVHSFDGAITAAVYVPIPKSAPLAMDAGWRVAASPGATALRTAQSLDSSGAPALEPADDASAASAAEGGSLP